MKLPNFQSAVIDIEKFSGYILNEMHPRGKHKAKIFKSVLGFVKEDAEELKEIISIKIQDAEAVETYKDVFGIRYYADLLYQDVIIRTHWIIKSNEEFPRFVTCYIKR